MGQISVMQINALLAKVIFDHNPEREFYLEESFSPGLDVSASGSPWSDPPN
jgi:hypothetical protein